MKTTFITLVIIIIGLKAIQFAPKSYITERRCKKYIIKHKDKIRFSAKSFPQAKTSRTYIIDTCELKYFEYITIRYVPEGYYSIIFWGDRKSWQWRFRLDKDFDFDMYRNNNSLDIEIDKIIQNKLKD